MYCTENDNWVMMDEAAQAVSDHHFLLRYESSAAQQTRQNQLRSARKVLLHKLIIYV